MIQTTDNQNKIFDVVNEKDEVIGQAKRGEAHGNSKLIHRSIGVAVFNSKGELFLQQRSETKDTEALKWTISCSGHVNSGGSYEETFFRELKEELGINCFTSPFLCLSKEMGRKERVPQWKFSGFSNLKQSGGSLPEAKLGTTPRLLFGKKSYGKLPRGDKKGKISEENILYLVNKFIYCSKIETEICVLYKFIYDGQIKINKTEIKQGKFFTRKELKEAIKSGEIEMSKMGMMCLEKLEWI
jgi:isopentenyldiphosphate isomerase